MSTKIHTGIVFHDKSINEVMDVITKWRKHFCKVYEKDTCEKILLRALMLYDISTYDKAFNIDGSPLNMAYAKWSEDKSDYLNVILFPRNKDIYGIVQSSSHDWFEKILEHPFVNEYAYYNNTDKPNEIGEVEWDYRGQLWDELVEYGSLKPQGLHAEIIDTESFYPLINEEIELPTFEERVNKVSRHIVVESFRGSIAEYLKYVQSEKYSVDFEATKKEIESVLIKDVSVSDLI